MRKIRYDFVLEATGNGIAHHQESLGNEAILMRKKVRQQDGTFALVPEITGDTMRHGIREAGAYVFLDAAGLLDIGQLGEAALRLLFTGGMVTGRGDASKISMDSFRELTEMCPPLALLGGCSDNRVIPGRIHCESASLICIEQERFLPEWVLALDTIGRRDTCRAYVEEVQRVRMDPLLDPGKRKLLSSGDEVEVTRRLGNSEMAHAADDAIARDDAKSTMMPRKFERLIQGSLFHWGITCDTYSELEEDTIRVMVAAFLSNARVGGKKGTGHGGLRPIHARDISVARPAENVNSLQLDGQTFGNLFRAHVSDRKDRIAEWLKNVNS